jgi:FlaG/FlaF family flagellin (archaellin)
MKWKIKKSTEKYSRINEFSYQFFDAIYENHFGQAKILIDDVKVNVNITNDCGDTPCIAVCQQTTLQNEEEVVMFINYLWQSGSKLNKSGTTAMNYAESNDMAQIVENLKYIQWMSLYVNLCNVGFI